MLLLLTHDDSFQDGADCSGQTVLLDAMASGLPIIASRKKYLEDYAEDREDMLLVNFYAPEDVVYKIRNLELDPDLRHKLAENSRGKIEQKFSTEHMPKEISEGQSFFCSAGCRY